MKQLTRNRHYRLSSTEDGYALFTIALILLILGALIIPPLLSFLGTGLKVGQLHEIKMYELYAADAGFQRALAKLTVYGKLPVGEPEFLTFSLNRCTVNVNMTNTGLSDHKIISVATHNLGSSTKVVSHVKPRSLLDNAITSNNDVTIHSTSTVDGDVYAGGEILPKGNSGEVTGLEMEGEYYLDWPTVEEISTYYLSTLDPASDNWSDGTIYVNEYATIDPLYRDGNIEIYNDGDLTVSELGGTIYVTDDATFHQPGGDDYTIDLHDQTIFTEGSISFPSHHVRLTGSGCIIAAGDIDFQPSIVSEPGDFIFVMSINGEINFKPNGDFTGSLAGNVNVDLSPGTNFSWTDPAGTGVNFPFEGEKMRVFSWNIDPQQ